MISSCTYQDITQPSKTGSPPTENIIRALTTCIYSFSFNGQSIASDAGGSKGRGQDVTCSSLPRALSSSARFVRTRQSMLLSRRGLSYLRPTTPCSRFTQSLLRPHANTDDAIANLRQRNDLSFCWWLDLSSHRRVPFQRLMRPHFVIVGKVFSQDASGRSEAFYQNHASAIITIQKQIT
jgi:hypothetical protein